MIGPLSDYDHVVVVITMCRNTDLNLNKTKYHVQGLVTIWILNRHYKLKVRYPEHGYHVNFPACSSPSLRMTDTISKSESEHNTLAHM